MPLIRNKHDKVIGSGSRLNSTITDGQVATRPHLPVVQRGFKATSFQTNFISNRNGV